VETLPRASEVLAQPRVKLREVIVLIPTCVVEPLRASMTCAGFVKSSEIIVNLRRNVAMGSKLANVATTVVGVAYLRAGTAKLRIIVAAGTETTRATTTDAISVLPSATDASPQPTVVTEATLPTASVARAFKRASIITKFALRTTVAVEIISVTEARVSHVAVSARIASIATGVAAVITTLTVTNTITGTMDLVRVVLLYLTAVRTRHSVVMAGTRPRA